MKKQVLIVDDNRQLLDELIDVFKDNAIDTVAVEDGASAIEAVLKKSFDVIVIDVRLPDFSGIDLIDKLKNKSQDAVFLLMTGYASADSAIKALQKGVLDYIVKPFSPDELLMSVKKAFLAKDSTTISQEKVEDLVKEKGILRAKVLMLEQINDIFIDREKKIIELKNEINNLLGKLGEDIKYTN